ncbi:inhibitor of apoptosis protein-like [Haliotis cracherodii]|uniref:inhibitor of apoptosis protein-like n=1 Tax=Haliotis cracherodii TaxID=6455 RepID=UPI0039ECBCBB
MSSPTRPEQQHVPREAPKHPQYETYSSRLESFVNWPARYVPKTPEQLATAGFFYIGSADRVTCFQCGITLRGWEEEHDPEAEHQRYSEHCQFIKKTEHIRDDPNNNQSCFGLITQLNFIANKIFNTDNTVAAKDVSNLEVKVSPITRPSEDSATFLKTTDKYEDD